ncbi:hypothetical protein BKA70DRAFT_651750 [Coprinopsis sp. MPI-PUGE-AT-0042]|nr:hypothetical protein BKA70DRAFT_651750 [Coprinopsis sp. MPI-PUGE-AT-0042]
MRIKDYHRPLKRYRVISGISCIILVCAFILFLLVSLSLPVIRQIFLLSVHSFPAIGTSLSELRFGVWGACLSGTTTRNVICVGPQLGYDIPPEFAQYLTYPPEIIQAVQGSLTLILVLHPVSTALVFLSAFTSLCLGSHAWSIVVLVISVIAGVIASVSLAIDIALVVTVRDYLAQIEGITLVVEFGNLVWMAIAGVVLVWLAIVLLSARVCYCCGVGPHHDPERWGNSDDW